MTRTVPAIVPATSVCVGDWIQLFTGAFQPVTSVTEDTIWVAGSVSLARTGEASILKLAYAPAEVSMPLTLHVQGIAGERPAESSPYSAREVMPWEVDASDVESSACDQ